MVNQNSSVSTEDVRTDSKQLGIREKQVMITTKKEISSFLKKWTKILGLTDWRINIVYENCEDEKSYMEIVRSVDYKRAKLVIPWWAIGEEDPPKDLLIRPDKNFWEESIVHELLHLVVTPMAVILRDDLEYQLHRDVFSLAEKSLRHAEERVVDNLSVSLCKAFKKIK